MKLEKLNPSVKMLVVLIAVIMLSFQYLVFLNLTVFAAAILMLLFFSDARPPKIAALLVPAFIAAFGLFMMGLYYTRGSSILALPPPDAAMEGIAAVPYMVRAAMARNLYSALQLSTRLLAFAGMGILFALTTPGEDFVLSLMHQCHLPPKFAYGILAAVNLMPSMVREFRQVRTAHEIRGIHAGPLSMKVLFTMLVNSIHWSEAEAMAMESKGFFADAPRTFHKVMRVRWYDLVFALAFLGSLAAMMILVKY